MESIAERKRAVQVGLIVLASAAALAALWLAREVVLLAFLGVLIGVVFSFPVGSLSRVVPRGVALLIVLVGLVGAAVGIAALAAPTLEKEIDQLRESAPLAIQCLMGIVVATPMLVCAQVLTQYLWIERRLGKERFGD